RRPTESRRPPRSPCENPLRQAGAAPCQTLRSIASQRRGRDPSFRGSRSGDGSAAEQPAYALAPDAGEVARLAIEVELRGGLPREAVGIRRKADDERADGAALGPDAAHDRMVGDRAGI